MEKIVHLFWETRKERLWARSQRSHNRKKGFLEIDAFTAAIREKALLDALSVLQYPKDKIDKMRKIE